MITPSPPLPDHRPRDFPGLLRFYRQRARLSQIRLSLDAWRDGSYVCKLEQGKREPSRETVLALAQTLHLSGEDTYFLLVAAGYLPRDFDPVSWVLYYLDRISQDQARDPAIQSVAARSMIDLESLRPWITDHA